MHTIGNIIGIIIFGAIVGALARLVLPGRQKIGLWVTIGLGIVGALLGYVVAGALGAGNTKGIDWIRDILSIVIAAVLVTVFERVQGARGKGA